MEKPASSRKVDLPFTVINVIISLILLMNGISLWVNLGWGGIGFFLSNSVVLGIYMVLSAILFLTLEFQRFEPTYLKNARFLLTPLGRGIAYIIVGIMTSGPGWWQIVSVVIILFLGFASIVVHFQIQDREYMFTGIIPVRGLPEIQTTDV